MSTINLQEIILDQRFYFNTNKSLIERDIDLSLYIKTSQIVVISGIRRCGKSTLMYQIKEQINWENQNYCYFNFDDERIVLESEILSEIYNTSHKLFGEISVFFFDEIQNVPNWEKFVNRMYEQGKKVYVTGSNSNLMNSEISTTLTGRNKLIHLFPFSFNEFLRFLGKANTISKLTSLEKTNLIGDFDHYMNFGGFPIILKENDLELINSFFQDIIYRDIVARFKIYQVNELKQIGLYLMSNISKLFSYSTLQNISGVKSLSTIKDYLFYYEQSLLFMYIKKFDYSLKKQIMNSKKVYTIDNAFMHRIGLSFSENKSRALENIVYIELKRRGFDVFYHSGKNECDFIICEGLKVIQAIQVVYHFNKLNKNREIAGLKETMQNFQVKNGLILVYHQDNITDLPENVKLEFIWNWLLKKE
jgi:predicted AAA+ superfamily ATPase